MDNIELHVTSPGRDGRTPLSIVVESCHGAWTEGPHAVLEAGTEMEFTLRELQWLRDTGLPAAIQKLTEIEATRGT